MKSSVGSTPKVRWHAVRLSGLVLLGLVAMGVPGGAAAQPLAASGPNLIGDGSFEFPLVGTQILEFNRGQNIGPWAVVGGNVDVVGPSDSAAANGNQSLDLSGATAGAIAQSVATVPGTTYAVRFTFAANPHCGPDVKTLVVAWDGAVIATLHPSDVGHTPTSLGWKPFAVSVTASNVTSQLEFRSLTPTHCGPMLDAVSVLPTGT